MAQAVFPERRTRSQLALPDDILQIPDTSPLKGARTALKNNSHSITPASASRDESDDSDDELLLSPGKQQKPSSSSKRSASPPPLNEYASGSGPAQGRELKRAKRDLTPPEGNETNVDNLKASNAFRQRLLSNHTRTQSDSNIAALQRSPSRKRSATTSKKPVSTVSASPPQTSFSPAPTTPRKDRARSVPLFPSNHDLPRIDFRNVPPSPKRKRSRSPSRPRSPSKEVELKQRIPSAMFVPSTSLPTIHDEPGSNMDVDQDRPTTPIVANPAPVEEPAEQETCLPAEIPTSNLDPDNPSTSAPSNSAIPSILPAIPATPVAQSLNKLIPLSPLTPLPETPLPPRKPASEDVEDRFASFSGWELAPIKEKAISSQSLMPHAAPIAPSTSKSRLPRPSMAPPVVPSQPSKLGMMGPPPVPTKSKQTAAHPRNASTSAAKNIAKASTSGKAAVNAFDVLMQKQRGKEQADTDKGKQKQKLVKPVPSNVFSSSSSGEKLAASSSQSKMKMKNKMRPKGKAKAEKPPATAPVSDEESEDEGIFSDPWRTTEVDTTTEPESEMEVEKPAVDFSTGSETIQPTELAVKPSAGEVPPQSPVPVAVMEGVDGPRTEGEATTEPPAQEDSTMNETNPEQAALVDDVQAGGETPFIPAENEVVPESPSTKPTLQDPSESNTDTPELASIPPIMSAPAGNEVIPETPPRANVDSRPAAGESVPEADKEEGGKSASEPADVRPPSRARASKLPLGKKRQPIAVPAASRVTRSVSNRKLGKGGEAPQAGSSTGPSTKTTKPIPAKRKPPVPVAKPAFVPPAAPSEVAQDAPATHAPMDVTEDAPQLPPGSPMKLSSPAKTPKRKTYMKSPMKSPMRFSLGKPASSPSPTKIARSSTLFSSKPTSSILSRTFSSDYQVNMGASSSLSTLSNALEKLRMPAPSRPSTSMGFNRDASGDDEDGPERSKDDTAVGRTSFGVGQTAQGLKRASTLGATSFKTLASTKNAIASSSKTATSARKNLVQKPIAMFMSNKGSHVKMGSGSLIRGGAKTSILGNKPIFGVGPGSSRRTISKKTTLPVVIGSPVKGTATENALTEGEEEDGDDRRTQAGDDADVFGTTTSETSTALTIEDLGAAASAKGKAKEELNSKMSNARRVSMVSHALSQSLNMPPPPPPAPMKGSMGPPPTPPSGRRSASSSYPSTSAGGGSPSAGTRSSARLAKVAEQVKTKIATDSQASVGKKEQVPPLNPAVEALKVLKDCVIFVDVRTDDGEEAGSLFVEMLEGVGARVLTRVGQTCTHIVYKNGLMSTVTRYRLLRDPKPLVVGIGWVVECVEQRKHVDEKDFLVDLEGAHVAGVNKRRRSMLPRLLAAELSLPSTEPDNDEGGEADRSVDGSNSSMTMDDDLAPLERARRRKSLMVGLRA